MGSVRRICEHDGSDHRVQPRNCWEGATNSLDQGEVEMSQNQPEQTRAVEQVDSISDPIDWHADAQWALQQWEDGAFDTIEHDYVVVYKKRTLGCGDDPTEFRRTWSENLAVPFQRIIVKYVGAEE
jgi:hypothetical protein